MCLRKDLLYPCGKCLECLNARRNEWSVRLQNEISAYDTRSNYFCTLTYDDLHVPTKEVWKDEDHIDIEMTLSKRDIEKFIKRLRKYVQPKRFRFFLAGEYGPTTRRPHYHLILFGFPIKRFKKAVRLINKAWQNGQVRKPWRLIPAQCHYATKYMIGEDLALHGVEPSFQKMSKGLGYGMVYGNYFLDQQSFVEFQASEIYYQYVRTKEVIVTKNYIDNDGVPRDCKEVEIVADLPILPDEILDWFENRVQDFCRIESQFDKDFKYPIPKYIRQKVFSKELRAILNQVNMRRKYYNDLKYKKDYYEYDLDHVGNEMWRQQAKLKLEMMKIRIDKRYKNKMKHLD